MHPKEQKSRSEAKSEEISLKPATEVAEESPQTVVTQGTEILTEVRSRAQQAYQAYMDAQKEVGGAYRANELQTQEAYKEREVQADKLCEQALELARSARDEARRRTALVYQTAIEVAQKAQQEANEAYEKALQVLDNEYDERAKEALQERATSIAEEWKAHTIRLERAWKVYAK